MYTKRMMMMVMAMAMGAGCAMQQVKKTPSAMIQARLKEADRQMNAAVTVAKAAVESGEALKAEADVHFKAAEEGFDAICRVKLDLPKCVELARVAAAKAQTEAKLQAASAWEAKIETPHVALKISSFSSSGVTVLGSVGVAGYGWYAEAGTYVALRTDKGVPVPGAIYSKPAGFSGPVCVFLFLSGEAQEADCP